MILVTITVRDFVNSSLLETHHFACRKFASTIVKSFQRKLARHFLLFEILISPSDWLFSYSKVIPKRSSQPLFHIIKEISISYPSHHVQLKPFAISAFTISEKSHHLWFCHLATFAEVELLCQQASHSFPTKRLKVEGFRDMRVYQTIGNKCYCQYQTTFFQMKDKFWNERILTFKIINSYTAKDYS